MTQFGDINPATGKRYSTQQIQRINSGLDPMTGLKCPSGGTISTSIPTGVEITSEVPGMPPKPTQNIDEWYNSSLNNPPFDFEGTTEEWNRLVQQRYDRIKIEHPPPTTTPTVPTMPTITPPTITPAPAYEISPEQQEMMDMLGQKITDWVESGGYGLPEEVQAQMIQQQSDFLKAREQENIRVMRNNMERRGITNSGFLLSAENTIHSNTTVAIAGAIADVQIKSALMKMASFEKGMGAMAQFLGFLSEQSQLAYAPEFATWQAEQLAKMQTWQAQIDLLKMEINQAYQTQNILLQGQLQSDYAAQQHGYNLELAEMEIEANQNVAMAQGIGSIFGTILGFIFGK